MTYSPLKPAPKSTAGNGIKVSLRPRKDGGSTFSISLAEVLQDRYFGRSLIGTGIHVSLGRNADAGKLQLRLAKSVSEPGAIEVRKMMRGSVVIKCDGWHELGAEKRDATVCTVVNFSIADGTVELHLPNWPLTPSKMQQEHGLKPIARVGG